jgi:rhodanese-related sulfurtransferase
MNAITGIGVSALLISQDFTYFANQLVKMKLATLSGILLAILSSSLCGQTDSSSKYISLDPYYFHLEYLKRDPSLIIDVREPFEFRGKRLREAINIPSSREMKALTDTLDRNFSLFLYCTTGYRSKRAAEKLYESGFRNLFNLEGGLLAWKREDMPVVKGKVMKKRVH